MQVQHLLRRALDHQDAVDELCARLCYVRLGSQADIAHPTDSATWSAQRSARYRQHFLRRDSAAQPVEPLKAQLYRGASQGLHVAQSEQALLVGAALVACGAPTIALVSVAALLGSQLLCGTGQDAACLSEPRDHSKSALLFWYQLQRHGVLGYIKQMLLVESVGLTQHGRATCSLVCVGAAALVGEACLLGRFVVVLPIELMAAAVGIATRVPMMLWTAMIKAPLQERPAVADAALPAHYAQPSQGVRTFTLLDYQHQRAREQMARGQLDAAALRLQQQLVLGQNTAAQRVLRERMRVGRDVHAPGRDACMRRAVTTLLSMYPRLDYEASWRKFVQFVEAEELSNDTWLRRPHFVGLARPTIFEAAYNVMFGRAVDTFGDQLPNSGVMRDCTAQVTITDDGRTMALRELCALVFCAIEHLNDGRADLQDLRRERAQALLHAIADAQDSLVTVVCTSGVAQRMVIVLQGFVPGVLIDEVMTSVPAFVTEACRAAGERIADDVWPSRVAAAYSSILRRANEVFLGRRERDEVQRQLIKVAALNYDVTLRLDPLHQRLVVVWSLGPAGPSSTGSSLISPR